MIGDMLYCEILNKDFLLRRIAEFTQIKCIGVNKLLEQKYTWKLNACPRVTKFAIKNEVPYSMLSQMHSWSCIRHMIDNIDMGNQW